jgi:putative ubiquitin-RnfH superfamily antitoxin RatB of RatAB toxin-antitoxin module
MPPEGTTKRCTVVHATSEHQWSWEVHLPAQGSVEDALRVAREQAGAVAIDWEADVGIFGELCSRSTVPRDGDRIELYRPLRSDPKESRRARAAGRSPGVDRASLRPRSPVPKQRVR